MISVIVPVYNVEKYLRQCIESILGQQYEDMEIILVDDGSTDSCPVICDAYAQSDARIKVIHKENGGLVSARKAGMKTSRGKYIAYVDGDDWIEPDMYARMIQAIEEQDVDIVMCGRYEDTGEIHREVYHGIPEGRYNKQKLLRDVYPRMIINDAFFDWCIFPGVWDKLFKRECVEAFQMAVDERLQMGEDAACVYPCLLNVNSIYVLHKCLYHYRQTTNSMVKRVQNYNDERLQFSLLYQKVNDSLKKYLYIYDLREQWKKYVLFLMVPRADGLLKGYKELDYLFPFPGVKKGMRIILYGAGTYGQRLYSYLQDTGFCRVEAWLDRKYVQLQKFGIPVDSPDILYKLRYDAIVIANTYASSRFGLYQELCRKYDKNKIYMIDEQLLFRPDITRRFGLSENT